jgi:hypothetical protein
VRVHRFNSSACLCKQVCLRYRAHVAYDTYRIAPPTEAANGLHGNGSDLVVCRSGTAGAGKRYCASDKRKQNYNHCDLLPARATLEPVP